MFKEEFEERAAIMEYDGGIPRDKAEEEAEKHRHECEVKYWARMYYRRRGELKSRMDSIKSRRGKDAADRMSADILALWDSVDRRSA